MKKTTKNPITFFREANEKRQAAVRNSLKKAQDGIIGPKTEAQTMMESSFTSSNDPMAYGRGPRATSLRQDMNQEMREMQLNAQKSDRMKDLIPNYRIDPTAGKMSETTPGEIYTPEERYKKGGSVKPSAGLSKKTKSNIAKKASAGKDIGKKGKGFAKVAAAAGGGEKGKRIAAAAMWKNIKRG